jgi:hypothetical protein
MLEIVTYATTGDLTVLARVKSELNITDGAQDATFTTLIHEASDLIAAYCNRDTFGREALRQTERITNPQEYIILDRDLAPTITALTVDATALLAAEYEIDGSLLYRLEDDRRVYWQSGKVVIEYGSGFTLLSTLPYALERAALDLVVNLYRGAGRDGAVRQEMVEGVGSTSYFDPRAASGGLPISADRLRALDRYRLVNVA